jgi:hypothetical protein
MTVNGDKRFKMRGSSGVRYGFAAGSFGVRLRFVFLGSGFVFCGLLGSFRLFLFSGVFVPRTGALDFAEPVCGAVPGAVEADFVAGEGFLGAGRMVEGPGGEHDLGGWFFVGGGGGLLALFVGEGGGFKGPDAEEAPAADGHGFDEVVLVLGGGAEAAGVGGEEGVEAGRGFAGEEDGAGEEAVGDGVLGGVAFALGGAWAGGFLGVGAVTG